MTFLTATILLQNIFTLPHFFPTTPLLFPRFFSPLETSHFDPFHPSRPQRDPLTNPFEPSNSPYAKSFTIHIEHSFEYSHRTLTILSPSHYCKPSNPSRITLTLLNIVFGFVHHCHRLERRPPHNNFGGSSSQQVRHKGCVLVPEAEAIGKDVVL